MGAMRELWGTTGQLWALGGLGRAVSLGGIMGGYVARGRDMGLVGLYGVGSEVIGSVWDWRRVWRADRELVGSIESLGGVCGTGKGLYNSRRGIIGSL